MTLQKIMHIAAIILYITAVSTATIYLWRFWKPP